jgi:hypothetical protein
MLPRKDHTDPLTGEHRGDARLDDVFMVSQGRDRVHDLGLAHQDNLIDGDCRVDCLAAAALANGTTLSFRDATIRFGDNDAFRLLEATCMNELQRYPADGMSAIRRALRARTAWKNPSGGR